MLSFYEGVGVGVLKIEESESEVLCTDFTALLDTTIRQVASCVLECKADTEAIMGISCTPYGGKTIHCAEDAN
jgi:hypothetical protein